MFVIFHESRFAVYNFLRVVGRLGDHVNDTRKNKALSMDLWNLSHRLLGLGQRSGHRWPFGPAARVPSDNRPESASMPPHLDLRPDTNCSSVNSN